jgi:hypothetical protein
VYTEGVLCLNCAHDNACHEESGNATDTKPKGN